MILHHGFEMPTPDQMEEWRQWFEGIAGRQIDRAGLRGRRHRGPPRREGLDHRLHRHKGR